MEPDETDETAAILASPALAADLADALADVEAGRVFTHEQVLEDLDGRAWIADIRASDQFLDDNPFDDGRYGDQSDGSGDTVPS